MISRVTAEFECPEFAELALKRVKESVPGVHSVNIMYNKASDRAMKLRHGTIYTILPMAVTTYNYMTAVMESPATEDVMPEPSRSRKTSAYVICEDSSADNIISLLNALGGLNVRHSK